MLEIKQITPSELSANRNHLEKYLKREFTDLVSENTWMTESEELIGRFQLLKLQQYSDNKIKKLDWNYDQIKTIIEDTFVNVSKYLRFNDMRVTVVPALPFPFFQEQPQSLWTNAYTNGPGNVIIAIPPQPDKDFLQYLLAHEFHHATRENPIYNLSLNSFTLVDWYKMEGTAEHFSLSLYPDKRWWKGNFPIEVETRYWNECKEYLMSTDARIKGPLCFGSQKKGIPVFAGYSFALKLVSNYVSTNPIKDIRTLFRVEPSRFIECYERINVIN